MSQIKGKNTKPELLVRRWLWANNFRYRLHYKHLPGKPDIVFPGRKKVIFVHGCFWHCHKCRYFKWPGTNAAFWQNKINSNVMRDKKNRKELKKTGWDYLVIWECDLKRKNLEPTWKKIKSFLEKTSS